MNLYFESDATVENIEAGPARGPARFLDDVRVSPTNSHATPRQLGVRGASKPTTGAD